ncbi:uncharacterized protein LOC116619061 isoform X2 [Nematostella vectensis]|nr:uncharacterized protein LOC116619061 isoform X2 [Nematostella vectensis]
MLTQKFYLGKVKFSSNKKDPGKVNLDFAQTCHSSQTVADIYRPLCSKLDNTWVNFQTSCQYLQVQIVCTRKQQVCPSWKWDVSDWTLSYEGSHRSTICAYPLRNERILRINYANGTTEYPECSLQKRFCRLPHYDPLLRKRINTDPCCRRNMLHMMRTLTRMMDERGINHVMISGAVIGWVRNRALVPYDVDVDFIVDEMHKEKFMVMVSKEFETLGYELFKRNGPTWICPHKDCKHICHPDMWFYKVTHYNTVEINYYTKSGVLWSQPYASMFPRQRGELEGHTFWFPAKPVEYLDREYGQGAWKRELQCTRMKDECIEWGIHILAKLAN